MRRRRSGAHAGGVERDPRRPRRRREPPGRLRALLLRRRGDRGCRAATAACPSPAADPGTRPVYAATDRGSPSLPRARRRAAPPRSPRAARAARRWACTTTSAARCGSRATARLLAPYVPVGLEIGVAHRSPSGGADHARGLLAPHLRPRGRLPGGAAPAGPGAARRRAQRAGRHHRPPRRGAHRATSSGAAAARRPTHRRGARAVRHGRADAAARTRGRACRDEPWRR